ncbi:type I-C CRISPR-associated protein Cas8c/Csd1 [Thiohalocapsa marina]|uniref:Type I-C CRISPR-associated protein Cas8c/Csd1 n=1 Tax=Thiohalocapsa marina TaxID=424902 RepID=A0A5M8FQA6_9GAMM|nr:type I-C CRISPR-associated protein Cas8c/Csd1 [Thiohalocapsa marina]KAA6185361.1 type I-C CRISPR-associated protein Cas8c/Csd1 [Thiohalocapsa marina]
MILQSLNQLYDRLAEDASYGIAPAGYSAQKIAFVVVLHPDGRLYGIDDVREEKGKRRISRQMLVPGQAKPSGSGINPCFLWDNSAYLLGHVGPKKSNESDEAFEKRRLRTEKSFDGFRAKHLDLESQIDDPGYMALCRFLKCWNPDRCREFGLLDELDSGFGVFQLIGETRYLHQHAKLEAWWKRQTDEPAQKTAASLCLVTGERAIPARTHEPKLKGVAGAQSSGAALVSFNCDAFKSYGKDQSLNAPVSEQAAFRYCTALNGLLSGPSSDKHRISVGDTTVVFWTEKATVTEQWLADFLSGNIEAEAQDETAREQTKALLQALRSGGGELKVVGDDPATPVQILGLAPNAARLAPRFWHTGSLGDLFDKLKAHHDALRVVPQHGAGSKRPDPEFPPIWMLLRETARESKDISPLLGGALMRAILEGTAYPDSLASAVIRRIRADRTINYMRAAILKAWLLRKPHQKGDISVSLDTDNLDPAYRLGRLFAVLESAQYAALGNVGAGIRDRFYSSASATPAIVFPRLLRTYQHHLGKMTQGATIAFEKRAQDIISGIDAMPSHLNLEAQARFALGYYHQRQALFDGAKKPESVPEKKE